ncbi:MAG TPA: hypothetical protein VLD58_01810, partial [Gemmatimonadales bacterium]|nr:hypothetical protein [Gemmatimonadales bacterium]
PVLSVDAGGVADRVRESGAGALYAPADIQACAEAAITLLRGDLAGLGRTARAFAERHHGYRQAFDGIFSVYRKVLARQG